MKTFLTRTCLFLLALVAVPAYAVNRTVTITAPAEAPAGSTVAVTISASTDAKDGEQIGFLHSEYSTDGGKTWTQMIYLMQSGVAESRPASFAVGAPGEKSLIRVRVAFRGGKAGDVDYMGHAIQWADSWEKWRAPAAKFAVIYVIGR